MLAYIHHKNGKYFLSKNLNHTKDAKELSLEELSNFIDPTIENSFPIQIKI